MQKLKSTPLYAQIKSSILARIAAKEWSPGSFLPSEITLAKDYGVSQGTLRKALNELTREKRLIRYQGKGTAVAILDIDSSLFPFFMLYDKNNNRVFPVSQTNTIQNAAAAEDEAMALHIAAGSEVIRIHRVRVLENKPVINECVVLPASRFPGFSLDLNRLPNTLYEFYFQQFGVLIVRATETLEAVNPDEQDKNLLKMKSVAPLLEVRRQAFDMEGNIVEFRKSRINTQNHQYRIELR